MLSLSLTLKSAPCRDASRTCSAFSPTYSSLDYSLVTDVHTKVAFPHTRKRERSPWKIGNLLDNISSVQTSAHGRFRPVVSPDYFQVGAQVHVTPRHSIMTFQTISRSIFPIKILSFHSR